MSDKSKIEWTDATRNEVRGCAKSSRDCRHCYADTFAERFRGVPGSPFEKGLDLRLVPEKLGEPFYFAQPRKVLVYSIDGRTWDQFPTSPPVPIPSLSRGREFIAELSMPPPECLPRKLST